MHFLGGFLAAMVFMYLSSKFIFSASGQNLKFSLNLILTLSFVALIGVFWEFFEFFYDVLISLRGYEGFMQLGAGDMLKDLFFDFLGGLFLIILLFLKKTKAIKSNA